MFSENSPSHYKHLQRHSNAKSSMWWHEIVYCSKNARQVMITPWPNLLKFVIWSHHKSPHHNRFMALFLGPPGWAGARRELLDFMVQGKINRGRQTDHSAGRHSIRTNQCLPPPSPHFLQAGCPSCRPTNSVTALKASQIKSKANDSKSNL